MTTYGETTARTSTDPGSKSAAEIEREVREERAHVEQTLDAIQDRLSPGQLVDQAVTYIRTSGGSDFVRNLGESVRQNPIPIALVGMGLAWMMIASSRGNGDRSSTYWVDDDLDEYDDEDDYYARTGYDAGTEYPYGGETRSATAGLYDAASEGERGPSWGDRAKATAEGAKERAEELRQRARDTAARARSSVGDIGSRARRAASEAGARVGGIGARARERVAHAGHDLSERAGQTGAYARQYGDRARRGFSYTLNEQPLVLGAIGLAVGAALGSILPRSEREDRLMGGTSDRLKQQAEELSREELAKAKAAARSAYDAAVDEADKQGLTPEGGREAMAAARQKVERVAEAAKEAAKEEAERRGLGHPGQQGTSAKSETDRTGSAGSGSQDRQGTGQSDPAATTSTTGPSTTTGPRASTGPTTTGPTTTTGGPATTARSDTDRSGAP
ncbi:MAG: hypothetical protein K0R41_1505 [Geminicoccaceae bacterium]|nr:hypothetical protein [Geminicoccaceae bacterium]